MAFVKALHGVTRTAVPIVQTSAQVPPITLNVAFILIAMGRNRIATIPVPTCALKWGAISSGWYFFIDKERKKEIPLIATLISYTPANLWATTLL
jgi:hypothetical protein